MKLVIVVGMPASGKNTIAPYARMKNYPHFSTGDIVREEIRKRGCSGDPETSAKVSTELRGVDGLGVTRMALEDALHQKADVVFLEGIRSWPEIEMIRRTISCVVVAFIAPYGMRLERIKKRKREDDSPADFDKRDKREIDYGVAVCIALADAYVLNTGSIDDAITQLDQIVSNL